MKDKTFTVSLSKNPSINVDVTLGHFTTNDYHINHFLHLDELKTNPSLAKEVAIELALPYLTSTLVDTIVCFEGTEIIGAYMANELSMEGTGVINSGKFIHVVTPTVNVDRKFMLPSSRQELVRQKRVILLVSTILSETFVNNIMEFITYYEGNLVGISSLFKAYPGEIGHEVHSLMDSSDVPGYKIYYPGKCDMCKEEQKLDGIIKNDGLTEITND